jgi:hypothetical protein
LYHKDSFLPLQRQIDPPQRDYTVLPDVIMTALDTAVTQVDADGVSAPQVARGSIVSDADGTRQATLLFPSNVTPSMKLADHLQVPQPDDARCSSSKSSN